MSLPEFLDHKEYVEVMEAMSSAKEFDAQAEQKANRKN